MLSDLRAQILADSAVENLVGTRMYPTIAPQSAALPYITYQVISAFRQPTMLAPDNLPEKRIQIDAWGSTFSQAHAVAEAIRQAIDGFSGTMGSSPGTEVQGVFADTERTMYEPEPELHRVSRDYRIYARE